MATKEIFCAFGTDIDSVAGWIGSYGGADSPSDIQRGIFASEVGVPRLLRLFKKYNLRTSFFIPGHSIETFPHQCKHIVDEGHEIGAHGYMHENPIAMTPTQEEAVLARSVEIIEHLSGRRPRGYVAPWWEMSSSTAALLQQYGFRYDHSVTADGNAVADAWDLKQAGFRADWGKNGSGITLLIACAALAVLARRLRRLWLQDAAWLAALAFVCAGAVEFTLKHLVGRPRPDAAMATAGLLGPSFAADIDSFPSGHATSVFAVAAVFATYYPRLRWPLYGLAAAIALGRVYLERHYLSDIIAGAALGLTVAVRLYRYRLIVPGRMILERAVDRSA